MDKQAAAEDLEDAKARAVEVGAHACASMPLGRNGLSAP